MISVLVVALLAVSGLAAPNSNHLDIKRADGDPFIPSGWTALGCFTDARDSRTLRTASTTSLDLMTLEVCAGFCTRNFGVFTYAGVEFGRECYCDNTIREPAVIADDSGCNIPCTGDTSQNCGGEDRIFIAQRVV
ncbi:WSC domain-containing protein [Collybia nuda]|uniref:WSC domain-containing protein n=1 Tax=Collybia nuda TaxID=64659 RepID=A0A9P6CF53_9AGAR|nr:WSC domain-containing protein [Collybia nuda]